MNIRLGLPLFLSFFNLFKVTVVIMSLLTNILVDAIGEECSGGEGALNAALTRIFTQAGGVFGFCQAYPGLRFFIAPPSVREKPSW